MPTWDAVVWSVHDGFVGKTIRKPHFPVKEN